MDDQTFVESKGTASGVHMNRRTNRGGSSACGGSARQKWLVYGAEVAKSRVGEAKVEQQGIWAQMGCAVAVLKEGGFAGVSCSSCEVGGCDAAAW
jgi:hypothetical protein